MTLPVHIGKAAAPRSITSEDEPTGESHPVKSAAPVTQPSGSEPSPVHHGGVEDTPR
jgi:hypothetical protein